MVNNITKKHQTTAKNINTILKIVLCATLWNTNRIKIPHTCCILVYYCSLVMEFTQTVCQTLVVKNIQCCQCYAILLSMFVDNNANVTATFRL